MTTLSPHDLARQLDATPALPVLDVRSPGEFRAIHLPQARNLPLDQLSEARVAEFADKDAPVAVICASGKRSETAAEKLTAWGYQDVHSIAGGTSAWAEAGLPVEKASGTISIERQVRIGAGSLVVLGVALGFWVHPGFFGLPAFVGAGLVFAGVTDFCGMGLLLARMPWNR